MIGYPFTRGYPGTIFSGGYPGPILIPVDPKKKTDYIAVFRL